MNTSASSNGNGGQTSKDIRKIKPALENTIEKHNEKAQKPTGARKGGSAALAPQPAAKTVAAPLEDAPGEGRRLDFIAFDDGFTGFGWYAAEPLRSAIQKMNMFRWMGVESEARFEFICGEARRVEIRLLLADIVHATVLPNLQIVVDGAPRPYTLDIGAKPPYMLITSADLIGGAPLREVRLVAPVRRARPQGPEGELVSIAVVSAEVLARDL